LNICKWLDLLVDTRRGSKRDFYTLRARTFCLIIGP
jgi:hypothetical protein